MVLTAAQTTFFWEDNAQGMMLPNATRIALQGEGLTAVADLSGLTQDLLDNIAWGRYQFKFAGIRYYGGCWSHSVLEDDGVGSSDTHL